MEKNGVDMVWEIPAEVERCVAALERAGHGAFLVGGCVRDMLLGRSPGDFDVTTAALPAQVQALFQHTVPTGLKHGTVTVLTEGGPVEVTTFRREGAYADGRHPDCVTFDASLEEDLARRDYTVNAMALDLRGQIIDPFGGRCDLTQGLLRCVGSPDRRFAEDALRMLRGVRFSAQLDFALEEETRQAMARNAWRLERISGERIKAEMEKLLLSPRPERAEELLALGLLHHLHPQGHRVDLSGLRAVDCAPIPRWQAFCAATGFPIAALPVERALRRAVEHPEGEALRQLAISGGALLALGLRGAEIGALQRRLAAHILQHPGDNEEKRLLKLAKELLKDEHKAL